MGNLPSRSTCRTPSLAFESEVRTDPLSLLLPVLHRENYTNTRLLFVKSERQPTAQEQRIVAGRIATRAVVIANASIELKIVDVLRCKPHVC